jgi:hypothetical protein
MSAFGAFTLRRRSGAIAPSSFETRALRAPQDEGASANIHVEPGEFLTLRRPRSGRLEGSRK